MTDLQDSVNIGPLAVVFAGPNGSGKTSLIDELRITGLATMRCIVPLPAYFINPDQVAKDLQGEFPDQMLAMRQHNVQPCRLGRKQSRANSLSHSKP